MAARRSTTSPRLIRCPTGRGYGHIAVRVGRVLLYLEDRDALQAWTTAIGKAADLADAAFGPDLPASRYQPPGGSN